MFIESRPVTGFGETAGWALPLLPQEPVPRVPLRRPPLLSANSSTPSLSGMEQTVPPAVKRPPHTTTDAPKSYSLVGYGQTITPFQEFIKSTPPLEEGKPLPPTPLRPRRRSSYGASTAASSREPSYLAPRRRSSFGASTAASSRGPSPSASKRRTSSIYSRTMSQWLPDSPVWSAADLADNPLPALPVEYLRPIAYSASTPELVETAPAQFLLEPRTYQPLLTTPSPTVSRATTPSPAPTSTRRDLRVSVLLPTALDVAEIPKTHLRTVSLEKAKATANALGAEHLLPEELRAKKNGTPIAIISKARSLEPIVKAPTPVVKVSAPIMRDSMTMFGRSIDMGPKPIPDLPSMTLIDAEGRDRVVGSPRLSVAPLPTFAFPTEPFRGPVYDAFPVGKHAPKTMISMMAQNQQDDYSYSPKGEHVVHERGRPTERGSRNSSYRQYEPNSRQRESGSSAREEEDAQRMAHEYLSLLAEHYRQGSESSASRIVVEDSDADVGSHMKMVPQPLFHGATQSGQGRSSYNSIAASVSPSHRRQYSDTSMSMRSQTSGSGYNSLLSRPPPPSPPPPQQQQRLSITANSRSRRSSMGTIPISPPFQYTMSPLQAAMPPMPPTPGPHRRNSNDNRVSAYWHIPTKGGTELLFRRSKEDQHPPIPTIVGPSSSSPKSPGIPLLGADIIAQRLQTPEATPEPSPMPFMQDPWSMQQQHHADTSRTTTSAPSPIPSSGGESENENENESEAGRQKGKKKELTAKQALLARITKGAVKYADKLTRPTGYEPRPSSSSSSKESPNNEPITLATLQAHLNTNPSPARKESPHLHPRPTSPHTKPKPRPNHASRPSLGWSSAAKSAFDDHHYQNQSLSQQQQGQKHKPSQTSLYTHTLTPARPLDERNPSSAFSPDSPDYHPFDSFSHSHDVASSGPAGRHNSFLSTFRDFRREAKAEKRREDIKKSIRVVGAPEGSAAAGGERRRSADGRKRSQTQGEGEGVGDGEAVRPFSGGWGRRSISWIGRVGGGGGGGVI